MSIKRLMKDLKDLGEDPSDNVYTISIEDMANIKVLITGPEDSLYSTGLFNVDITVPLDSYPFEPPVFNFTNPIFHPNVRRNDGEVCMDILKTKWVPTITLRAACEACQQLLRDPNPDSPHNVDAAIMLREQPRMFGETVKMWTNTFARGCSPVDINYQSKLDKITRCAPSREEALQMLTRFNWSTDLVRRVFESD